MHTILQRLRGGLGTAAMWGASWAALGACLTLLVGFLLPQEIDAGEGAGRVAAVFGLAGLLCGLGFAVDSAAPDDADG